MLRFAKRFLEDQTGATAVEYALIAGFIAAVIAAAVGALGVTLSGMFDRTKNVFP